MKYEKPTTQQEEAEKSKTMAYGCRSFLWLWWCYRRIKHHNFRVVAAVDKDENGEHVTFAMSRNA
jgi:hypothetical protein